MYLSVDLGAFEEYPRLELSGVYFLQCINSCRNCGRIELCITTDS